ncbi:MAG: glycerophosphodiester phosphodiesterase [Bacteroidetes bacterium]|nr:glycerophosphodiester phosphodiesterase [Bacteroidota bacterium]
MQVNLDFLLSRPIAHRGLHSPTVPENSLAAFKAAMDNQYAIELDVQVIADHEVVVFHDDNIQRMCGTSKPVDTLVRQDLGFCVLKSGAQNRQETIPLLTEVFRLIDGRVPILIEIKRQPQVKQANSYILNELKKYQGAFAIQSFDPMILGWFAKHAPHIIRGQLSSNFKSEPLNPITKYLLRNFKLNFVSKPAFIAYDVKDLPRADLERRRKKGEPVIGWTVDSQTVYEKVKSYCDNIIFEGFQPLS